MNINNKHGYRQAGMSPLQDFSSTFSSIFEATSLFSCPVSLYKLNETIAWAY